MPLVRSDAVVITFTCPWPDPPLRSNKRLHHMAEHRIKQDIRQAGFIAAKHSGLAEIDYPVHIRMVWSVPTKHRRDADSGQPTLKSWIDGVVSAGLISDDNWQCVPRAWCEIEHHPGEPMSVRVEIEPAERKDTTT
jgi:Holliday junction resolvase RusA-like endonuclease